MPDFHQPRLIMKAARDQDLYIGWSTMCEAPECLGTRAEFLAHGVDPERLDRADVRGTSFIDFDFGGWDTENLIAEQRGLLPRRHLAAYAELWLDGHHDKAFDLLEPFEDETEVRRG